MNGAPGVPQTTRLHLARRTPHRSARAPAQWCPTARCRGSAAPTAQRARRRTRQAGAGSACPRHRKPGTPPRGPRHRAGEDARRGRLGSPAPRGGARAARSRELPALLRHRPCRYRLRPCLSLLRWRRHLPSHRSRPQPERPNRTPRLPTRAPRPARGMSTACSRAGTNDEP